MLLPRVGKAWQGAGGIVDLAVLNIGALRQHDLGSYYCKTVATMHTHVLSLAATSRAAGGRVPKALGVIIAARARDGELKLRASGAAVKQHRQTARIIKPTPVSSDIVSHASLRSGRRVKFHVHRHRRLPWQRRRKQSTRTRGLDARNSINLPTQLSRQPRQHSPWNGSTSSAFAISNNCPGIFSASHSLCRRTPWPQLRLLLYRPTATAAACPASPRCTAPCNTGASRPSLS